MVLSHLALVQVNFAPHFVADPGKATVKKVADHVEHIANVAGKLQYVSFVFHFFAIVSLNWFLVWAWVVTLMESGLSQSGLKMYQNILRW